MLYSAARSNYIILKSSLNLILISAILSIPTINIKNNYILYSAARIYYIK